MLNNYKVILWDFDGVIMDSMPIRSNGFRLVLANYPAVEVDELMKFHLQNGGLSRYVKFRHFFETIRKEIVSDEFLLQLANSFSKIMLENLIDKKLFISDSLNFIKNQHQNYQMHIVSGSDGKELNQICKALNIDQYFLTINGSPTPKKELVATVLKNYNYDLADVVLIGDSVNDFEAADHNKIAFAGYNNNKLVDMSAFYINSFKEFTS